MNKKIYFDPLILIDTLFDNASDESTYSEIRLREGSYSENVKM